MKNQKAEKVKTGKQIIYHVTVLTLFFTRNRVLSQFQIQLYKFWVFVKFTKHKTSLQWIDFSQLQNASLFRFEWCKQWNHSQIASISLNNEFPWHSYYFLPNILEVIPDTYQEHALKCFRTTKVLARRLSASNDLEIQFSRNEKKPPLDRGALKTCTFKVLHKLGTSCLA